MAGAARSLQNCRFHGLPWNGGFDSRALPPFKLQVSSCKRQVGESRMRPFRALPGLITRTLLLLLTVALVTTACGKKAPPSPIEKEPPAQEEGTTR